VKKVLIVFVLTLLFLQGCSWIKSWGDDEPGDPAPLVEFKPSLKVGKVWSTNIGAGMGKQGISMGPVFSSGKLFAADYEGMLVAVDADTGKKDWELKTKQPFSGGPGLDQDQIYMGTIDGRVIAYDRNGGAELWNAQVSSEVLIPPVSSDGVVVVRCIDGRVSSTDDHDTVAQPDLFTQRYGTKKGHPVKYTLGQILPGNPQFLRLVGADSQEYRDKAFVK